MKNKNTQSRKWQITINNPVEKGFDHDRIKQEMSEFKALRYYCMVDEMGETYHTHVYAVFNSPVRFSTMKKHFQEAHFEMARGTSEENRDYIRKSGKWQDDEKHETSVPDTFEEYGDIPEEHQGERTDLAYLLELLRTGYSNYEIIDMLPDYLFSIDRIERARQMLKAEENKDVFRNLNVTYIWGKTGTGKTRSVMDKFGYTNVYRVTDYIHPFDSYAGEDVIVFDEFRCQLKLGDMLNYLDGYPIPLPCRYTNRQACYTQIYIISNIPLEDQYRQMQIEQRNSWEAFLRRIDEVIQFPPPEKFYEVSDDEPCPFEEADNDLAR
ncbi:MAG: replication protein [Clostridia bacterium]|nr:replication protein [Clostridia bacterium]